MDIRQYFKKIRDIEASIKEPYPLIVSADTEDGGKAGTVMEVSREEAAKAIAEGRAVAASEQQKKDYFEQEALRKQSADKAELSRRLQIAIISDADFRQAITRPEKQELTKGER
jgi:hypothetical protein